MILQIKGSVTVMVFNATFNTISVVSWRCGISIILIYNMIEIQQRHDTTEIVLKVALNTITLTYP
jgi:hypothetical protein